MSKDLVLTDINGTQIMPITRAQNVYISATETVPEALDNKASKKDLEDLIIGKIPTEYMDSIVSREVTEYVNENSGGFATQTDVSNLSNEIGNHEVTQLYNYNEVDTSGYYVNDVLTNNKKFGNIIIPVSPNQKLFINHVFTELTLTFFNANKEIISNSNLIGNSFTVPNDNNICYVSIPIRKMRMYETFISDCEVNDAGCIPYGETEILRKLIKRSDFYEKSKSEIYIDSHFPLSVLKQGDYHGRNHEFYIDGNVSDGSGFPFVAFNTSECVTSLTNGFLLIGYNNNNHLCYQSSQAKFLLCSSVNSDYTVVKELGEAKHINNKKVKCSIKNGVLLIKDYYTNEEYVKTDIQNLIDNYISTVSFGFVISQHNTYSNTDIGVLYDSTCFVNYNSPNYNNDGVNHWNGKTWYAYGTSLTSIQQGKYVPFVSQFSGLNVVNKGVPGGDLVTNKLVYNALMDNTDGKINADLITIEVGANDGQAPLGEISSLDTSTFCGALNTCLKNILLNCPNAQVVLMNSTRSRHELNDNNSLYELGTLRSGGNTYEERDEVIRRVAQANGIYYIPFGSGLGMGLFRQQSNNLYDVDNIHHTELGGYNLAQGVWSYLKNIPLWYSEMPN